MSAELVTKNILWRERLWIGLGSMTSCRDVPCPDVLPSICSVSYEEFSNVLLLIEPRSLVFDRVVLNSTAGRNWIPEELRRRWKESPSLRLLLVLSGRRKPLSISFLRPSLPFPHSSLLLFLYLSSPLALITKPAPPTLLVQNFTESTSVEYHQFSGCRAHRKCGVLIAVLRHGFPVVILFDLSW